MNSPSHDQKVLYQLSLCAGLVAGTPSLYPGDLEKALHQHICYNLKRYREQLGEWEIVWGPIVLLDEVKSQANNSMYVAQRQKSQSVDNNPLYVVAIAGTNPTSIFDWLVNDFNVKKMISWRDVMQGITKAPSEAGISESIHQGLDALLKAKPTGDRPQAGSTLVEFLSRLPKPITLTTTGHSKGGALASTLALWLKDSQSAPEKKPFAWDEAGDSEIYSMPTAGPTAGNRVFAEYSDNILKTTVTRFANSLDIVPHAWSPDTLDKIRMLYEPDIHTKNDPTVNSLVDCAKSSAKKGAKCMNGGDYTQIQPDSLIEGKIIKGIITKLALPFSNFSAQAVCQHTGFYDSYFRIDSVEINPPLPNLPRIQPCKQPIYLQGLPSKCKQESGQG